MAYITNGEKKIYIVFFFFFFFSKIKLFWFNHSMRKSIVQNYFNLTISLTESLILHFDE